MSLIIINGDDFGYNSLTNQAIITSFRLGYISSTTIMVNMPGFTEACELAHKEKLVDYIGLHLNLTEGKPLTHNIVRFPRFCREGYFVDPRKGFPLFPLSPSERRALREEVVAQITACRVRGLQLTHIDSHHHVHTFWPIGQVVVQVSREFGIRQVRLSRNCGKNISFLKWIYKTAYNFWLHAIGMSNIRYFGSITDFAYFLKHHRRSLNYPIEIMTHPRLMSNHTIVDSMGMSSIPLKEKLCSIHIPLDGITSYKELPFVRGRRIIL